MTWFWKNFNICFVYVENVYYVVLSSTVSHYNNVWYDLLTGLHVPVVALNCLYYLNASDYIETVSFILLLKALDTFGNCQRPVFTLGVFQNMQKIITNPWKLVSICHRSCTGIMVERYSSCTNFMLLDVQ